MFVLRQSQQSHLQSDDNRICCVYKLHTSIKQEDITQDALWQDTWVCRWERATPSNTEENFSPFNNANSTGEKGFLSWTISTEIQIVILLYRS